MIDGVKITPLNQIYDERGKVMHMLRNDSPLFKTFGEIYFSITYPGVVKAWHLHKKMTLNYAVISGKIKFVLYDLREGSKSRGQIQEIFISPENYSLVTVPPKIWNGFKSIGNEESIIANCADVPHASNEISRLDPTDTSIPYKWDIKLR
jgi:dTDP-4-dehydrorhamnose 3,5-epimerase